MQRIKPALPVSLVLAATLLLTACGGAGKSTTTTASPGGSLSGQSITLYNGQHEQTTAMLVAAFEKQTGIKVNVRSGDEAELANQILQEGSNSPADVFYTENTPALEAPARAGPAGARRRRRRSRPSRLATAPRRATGWASPARVSVLVYNTAQISPSQLPSSILELAEPKWKGKLGFAPSETDFQPLITSITKLDGSAAAEKWLEGMKANSKIYPDNETVVAQVNNGESAVGLINHYYWYRLRDEVGQSGMHSALALLRPARPGRSAQRVRRSGAEVELTPGRGTGASSPSWSAPKARRRSLTATATSTRCAQVSARRRGCDRSRAAAGAAHTGRTGRRHRRRWNSSRSSVCCSATPG